MKEGKQVRWISGFWKRIGAFFIDFIVLGVVGFGLGLFLEDVFVQIGVWGRVIGFAIAITYFGILNSKLGNGQTIGKRLLNLKVVNSENESIELTQSIARYSILAIPFFLNGAQFSDDILTSFWMYILSLVVFGGLFSVIYLYIFNRVTRQSLHDIAIGTYVVNANKEKEPILDIWKPHYVVVILLFITAAIVPVFTSDLVQKEPFAALMKSRSALMEIPTVRYATVSVGKSVLASSESGSTETSYVSAQVFLDTKDVLNVELAQKIAESIIGAYPESTRKDVIQITLVYGYDIGIMSWWTRSTHSFDPDKLLHFEIDQSNNVT